MSLKNYILDIQWFQKERVLFKDITPLLIGVKSRKESLEILLSAVKDKKLTR